MKEGYYDGIYVTATCPDYLRTLTLRKLRVFPARITEVKEGDGLDLHVEVFFEDGIRFGEAVLKFTDPRLLSWIKRDFGVSEAQQLVGRDVRYLASGISRTVGFIK